MDMIEWLRKTLYTAVCLILGYLLVVTVVSLVYVGSVNAIATLHWLWDIVLNSM